MDCGEVGGSAACQVNPAQQTAAHATVPRPWRSLLPAWVTVLWRHRPWGMTER
jgi:hypothetical protein